MPFDKYGYDRRAELRAHNLGLTLQKTDRILTGNSRISVRVNTSSEDTHSYGNDIYLGFQKLDLNVTRDVLAGLGMNYHELAHILFTPRMNPSEMIWDRGNGDRVLLKDVFNFLEEARIETLFGAKYNKAKHFFTLMVAKVLLGRYENPDNVMSAESASSLGMTQEQAHAIWTHLLVYGRKYLPSDIRDAVREFAEDVLSGDPDELRKVRDAEAIVDEYRTLPTSKLTTRGKELAILLCALYPGFFEAVEQQARSLNPGGQPHNPMQDGQSVGRGVNGGARQNAPEEEQEDAAEKAQQDEDDGYEEIELSDDAGGSGSDESEDDEDDADGDDSEGDDTEGDDGDSTSGKSKGKKGKGQKGDSGSGDSEEADDDDSGDPSNSAGRTLSALPSDATLSEILEAVAVTVSRDSRVQKDVEDVMDAMDSGQERGIEDYIDNHRPPTPEEQETGRKLALAFQRLHEQVTPGWNYGSDNGRLNVARAMDPDADPDTYFDEWDEGREQDTAVELAILVDMSGSMSGGRIEGASSFAWVVADALKDVEAKVTVYGFSNEDEYYLLRGRDDEHLPDVREFRTIGGTSPAYALNAIKAVLNTSDIPNRELIVMTDGHWSPNMKEGVSPYHGYTYDVAATYERQLSEVQAHKTLIGIGDVGMGSGGYFDQLAAHFDVAAQCSDVTELVEPILRAIESMVRANAHI